MVDVRCPSCDHRSLVAMCEYFHREGTDQETIQKKIDESDSEVSEKIHKYNSDKKVSKYVYHRCPMCDDLFKVVNGRVVVEIPLHDISQFK